MNVVQYAEYPVTLGVHFMLHVKLSGFVPLSGTWRGKPVPQAAPWAVGPACTGPTAQHDPAGSH